MAATTIYKPGTSKGPVLLVPSGTTGVPTITDSAGHVYQGRFLNDRDGRRQFVFDPILIKQKGLKVTFGDQTGVIESGGQAYEGNGVNDWSPRAKGSIGPNDTTGVPGAFKPGQSGDYGAIPAYIADMFPDAVLAQYKNIKTAPYNFTDPMKFAQAFGAFNRGEIQKNFDQSKDIALQSLNGELSALKDYLPAASALKRNEVSIDNQFNQAQRTQQVNSTLPHAAGDLEAQRGRANAYASGNLPDSVQNSAFELGIRSASADRSAAGGFGASSSVARKASDLLSAQERTKLSQYGDQLVSSNLQHTANLYLAPTEYSNAGSQINVNPSLSFSQLAGSAFGQVNQETLINPATGLQSQTQQNQFTTGLEQQTRQFNATNRLNVSEFNAGQLNTFALDKFGYQAGYANSVASGTQTNINTNFQLAQQQLYLQLMKQYQSQAQDQGLFGSIASGLGSITGKGGGGGGGSSDSIPNNPNDPNDPYIGHGALFNPPSSSSSDSGSFIGDITGKGGGGK